MREVVGDATVLIFLGKLRALEYLERSYERVLIPPTVYEEVVERGKEVGAEDAIAVERAVDDGWITVRPVESTDSIEPYGLETGETAVLSLALELGHEEVLADEERVREVARLHGLRPRGTIHFLFLAIQRGDLTFDGFLDSLDRLLDVGFYLDEAVYLEAVRTARRLASGA